MLAIKATSEQNERFADRFKKKPETEAFILDFILNYEFSDEEHQVRYNQPQQNAILLLKNKMIEYGYPFDDIDNVENCIKHSQNAYLNKESLKMVRTINRMFRRGEPVTSEIIDQFVSLSRQHKPDEITEKAPLREILQIFV